MQISQLPEEHRSSVILISFPLPANLQRVYFFGKRFCKLNFGLDVVFYVFQQTGVGNSLTLSTSCHKNSHLFVILNSSLISHLKSIPSIWGKLHHKLAPHSELFKTMSRGCPSITQYGPVGGGCIIMNYKDKKKRGTEKARIPFFLLWIHTRAQEPHKHLQPTPTLLAWIYNKARVVSDHLPHNDHL